MPPGACFACEDDLPTIVEKLDEASTLETVPEQHLAALIKPDFNHDYMITNHDP
jgi:hypothetical protein